MNILVLPGDGIGVEIVAQAVKVLDVLNADGIDVRYQYDLVGGAAWKACGDPLPAATLDAARAADAILFGAVGGPQFDSLPRDQRPEQALLRLRKSLDLFTNLRPIMTFPELAHASSLKPELVDGLDILIVRELTGDIYFGRPRGIETGPDGKRTAINTMVYTEDEIRRAAHAAFRCASMRRRKIASVDKSNVLEASQLWQQVTQEVARDYPDVELSHLLVDNAAMQLVRQPKQFDVIFTGNMFGDILSDEAAMLTGSIGMLPSASLNGDGVGLYEPAHGSAPDIAGKDIANPLAQILSLAMMFRYSGRDEATAARIEDAVRTVIARGLRTADIASAGTTVVGTSAMGDAIAAALAQQA
jgi:3-isopropylmalate dehydrogenase